LGAGGVVDCHVGSIDEGEEVVVSFVVSPQKQGEVQHMITVESIEADTDQANNVSTQTTTVVVPEQPASTPTAVPMPTESPEPTLPSPTATLPPPPTIAEIVTQMPTPTAAPIPTKSEVTRLRATPTEGPAPIATPESTQVPTPAVIPTVTPEPEVPKGGGCSAPASRFEHLEVSWALLGFMLLGLEIVRR